MTALEKYIEDHDIPILEEQHPMRVVTALGGTMTLNNTVYPINGYTMTTIGGQIIGYASDIAGIQGIEYDYTPDTADRLLDAQLERRRISVREDYNAMTNHWSTPSTTASTE